MNTELPLGDAPGTKTKTRTKKATRVEQPVKVKQEVAVVEPKRAATPAVLDTPEAKMTAVLQTAMDPRIDAAKARELREMYQSMEKDHRDRLYNTAMHAAQSEMPRITKDKQADRFKYATLENVSRNIDPVARRHGFTLSYGTQKAATPGNIVVIVDVMHTGGAVRQYESPEVKPDNAGLKDGKNKTDIQGAGASLSYMRRYLKCMVFDVIIDGEDVDGAKRKAAKPVEEVKLLEQAQVESLIEQAQAVDCPVEKLVYYLNRNKQRGAAEIEKLSELPGSRYNEAVDGLTKWKNRT